MCSSEPVLVSDAREGADDDVFGCEDEASVNADEVAVGRDLACDCGCCRCEFLPLSCRFADFPPCPCPPAAAAINLLCLSWFSLLSLL